MYLTFVIPWILIRCSICIYLSRSSLYFNSLCSCRNSSIPYDNAIDLLGDSGEDFPSMTSHYM